MITNDDGYTSQRTPLLTETCVNKASEGPLENIGALLKGVKIQNTRELEKTVEDPAISISTTKMTGTTIVSNTINGKKSYENSSPSSMTSMLTKSTLVPLKHSSLQTSDNPEIALSPILKTVPNHTTASTQKMKPVALKEFGTMQENSLETPSNYKTETTSTYVLDSNVDPILQEPTNGDVSPEVSSSILATPKQSKLLNVIETIASIPALPKSTTIGLGTKMALFTSETISKSDPDNDKCLLPACTLTGSSEIAKPTEIPLSDPLQTDVDKVIPNLEAHINNISKTDLRAAFVSSMTKPSPSTFSTTHCTPENTTSSGCKMSTSENICANSVTNSTFIQQTTELVGTSNDIPGSIGDETTGAPDSELIIKETSNSSQIDIKSTTQKALITSSESILDLQDKGDVKPNIQIDNLFNTGE